MPLRIAFAVALTIAACASVSLVAPLSAHAVSSSDDADLNSSDSVPIAGPTGAAVNREGTVGVNTSRPESHPDLASAHLPSLSGVSLALTILAGFLPAIVMMVRSHRRRRASAHSGASHAGSLHAGDSASFGAA
jgi:hypothetical protein